MRKWIVLLLAMTMLGTAQGYTPHSETVETSFGEVLIIRRYNPFDGGTCLVTAQLQPAPNLGPYASTFRIREAHGERSLSVEVSDIIAFWEEREEDALMLAYINEEVVELIGAAYTRPNGEWYVTHSFYTDDMAILSASDDIHFQKPSEQSPLTFVLQHELIEATIHYFKVGCADNPFFQQEM